MAIFARDGETPVREVLLTAALALRPKHHMMPPPRPILIRDAEGNGLRRYFKDKLGDIIHVWRAHPLTSRNLRSWTGEGLRKIRAMHGVGRPIAAKPPHWYTAEDFAAHRALALGSATDHVHAPAPVAVPAQEHIEAPGLFSLAQAVNDHGSQRAAARWLGMNLSTFQRRLAKEAAP